MFESVDVAALLAACEGQQRGERGDGVGVGKGQHAAMGAGVGGGGGGGGMVLAYGDSLTAGFHRGGTPSLDRNVSALLITCPFHEVVWLQGVFFHAQSYNYFANTAHADKVERTNVAQGHGSRRGGQRSAKPSICPCK